MSSRGPAKPALYNVKTADDIERQRRRLDAEKAQELFQKRRRRNKILTATTAALVVLVACALVLRQRHLWPFKAKVITPANSVTNLVAEVSGGETNQPLVEAKAVRELFS